MTLKVAIQMDFIGDIDFTRDSTFLMAMEAQNRGYEIYHYLVSALRLEDGKVTALANKLEVRKEHGNHYTLGKDEIIDLKNDIDIVLMRQDPPFNMEYITATHILDHIKNDTLVLNDPAQVRNSPEKLLVTHFPDLTPPTLITSDKSAILEFYKKHKNIVLKPLYGCGGEQIYHIDENNPNLNVTLDMFRKFYKEPIVAQRYIPEIREGDKRIIIIDGEPAATILRVPADNDARANFHAGATPKKFELSARDLEICAEISSELKKRSLVFVAIDIIGEYLTEINVTSPGLEETFPLNGVDLGVQLWDAFEKKLAERKS